MKINTLRPIGRVKKPRMAGIQGEKISISLEEIAGPTEAPAKLANTIKKNAAALVVIGLGIVDLSWRVMA